MQDGWRSAAAAAPVPPQRYDSLATERNLPAVSRVPSEEETEDNWRSPNNRQEHPVNQTVRFFKRSTDHFLRAGLSALSAAAPHHHHHRHHHHHHHHHHGHDLPTVRKRCTYFANGYCREGDRCHYAHDQLTRQTDEQQSVGLSVAQADPIRAVRAPVAKPTGSVLLAELTERQLSELRTVEIEQLKKRFPGAVHEQLSNGEDAFVVPLTATDPDWPYDVRTVQLRIRFPVDYPKSCPMAEISEANNEQLPPVLSKHLTRSVHSWLTDTHAYNTAAGKIEIIFRPFLRWFDRSMEELFTEGLRMVKRNLDAENAGIVFVPFSELIRPTSPLDDDVDSEDDDDDYDEDESEEEDDDDLPTVQTDSTPQKLYPNLEKLSLLDNEVVHPVSKPASSTISSADKKSSSSSSKPKFSCDYRAPQKGTEISFRNLQLGENVASVLCQKMHVTVQCRRCKTNHDVITDPKRRNGIPCKKCHGQLMIAFRPNLMHQFSAVVGYLDLDGCLAFDLPVVDCVFAVECLACNKPMRSEGIHYGQPWTAWCHTCNAKLTVYVDSAKFSVLQSNRVADRQLLKLEKKDKRSKADAGTAAIQEGRPLPNNGSCRHYKKSYRWFRFPCCGKCYPCDLCHNDKEVEHEMKFATRIICGFCAKEQPFSSKAPCIVCGSTFNHIGKGHWEGGKGCRDKIRMNREDSHKYSGLGKTVSKKSKETQEKGKKKSISKS